MTKAKLIEELNKITAERDSYLKQACNANDKAASIAKQLQWHREMNERLIEAISFGMKEANMPRRPV